MVTLFARRGNSYKKSSLHSLDFFFFPPSKHVLAASRQIEAKRLSFKMEVSCQKICLQIEKISLSASAE